MEFVLRDRRKISEDGMLMIIIPINIQEEKTTRRTRVHFPWFPRSKFLLNSGKA